MGDTSWFPTPRERVKAQQPLSGALLAWLMPLAAVIAGVGATVVLLVGGSHDQTPGATTQCTAAGAPAGCRSTQTTSASSPAESARDAFRNCLRSAGGGGGGVRGFGASASRFRDAASVCSALLGQQHSGPAKPAPQRTPAAPVA